MCTFTGTLWRTAVGRLLDSCAPDTVHSSSQHCVFAAKFTPEWCQAALYLCEEHLLYWECTCCFSCCRYFWTRRILGSECGAVFCLTPACSFPHHKHLPHTLDYCTSVSYFVHVVGRQPVTLESQVPFQASPLGFMVGKVALGWVLWVLLFCCVVILPLLHIHSVTVADAIHCPLLTALLSNTCHIIIHARHDASYCLMLLENPGLST
jgi:hypothetical protein